MENRNNQNHFGLDSVKKSLKHFVVGKGMNIILSLSILLSLARLLDQADYAAFVSWQALVILIGLISSVGTQPVLQRFLAELRSQENNVLVYRLLTFGAICRFGAAFTLVFLLVYCFPGLFESLSIPGNLKLLSLFLFVGAVRVTSLTISLALDSLLWQKLSQASLVSANIFRIVSIIYVHNFSNLTIEVVVWIELGAEIVFLSFLLFGYLITWKKDDQRHDGNIEWWGDNKKRVVRYGASRYIANLSKLMYGGAPNRLLVAQFMPIREVAMFGFADSLLNLGRRFAPVELLLGFIRPIFVAKYTTTGSFSYLVKMTDIIFRFNILLLMVVAVGMAVLGEPVMNILSGYKYSEVYLLLVGFILLLIFEGFRLNLELLIEITELNSISIISNSVQSLSLFIAIPFFPVCGLWAIVIANVSGTFLACAICVYQLKKHGYSMSVDLVMSILILLNTVLTYFFSYWVYHFTNSIVLSAITILIVYGVLNFVLRPFRQEEINLLMKIISKKKGRRLDV